MARLAPLSFAQERLWFLEQLHPIGDTYNVAFSIRLRGALNVAALERAFITIVQRHEVLRTHFRVIGGQCFQEIDDAPSFQLRVLDIPVTPATPNDELIRAACEQEAQCRFDLEHGPLLRVQLIRAHATEHVLSVAAHHTIVDGWSLASVLTHEMKLLYCAYATGTEPELPSLEWQYADYATWQRAQVELPAFKQRVDYWKERLADINSLSLPADRPRPATSSFRGGTLSFSILPELLAPLKTLGASQRATLYMVLLAALKVVLSRWSGQDDVSVGTAIAGRIHRKTRDLMGCFVNTLVLRTQFPGDPTFIQFLQQVRDVALGAYAHQDVPFEKLVAELRPERLLSRQALFQILFTLQNYRQEAFELFGVDTEPFHIERRVAAFDLSWLVVETQDGLRGVVEYATDLFDAGTIQRLVECYQSVLAAVVEDAGRRISELQLLSDRQRSQILLEWNATDAVFPRDCCLHDLYEDQVRRTPHAVAVVYEEQSLTYLQLDRRANQLAALLRALGIGLDQVVGVYLTRSLELVVSTLAVLKAGGAYTLLDPQLPAARLMFAVHTAQARWIVSRSALQPEQILNEASRPALDEVAPQVRYIYLDEPDAMTIAESSPPARTSAHPDNLACVMFTSGSSGEPKGIATSHRALVGTYCGQNYADFHAEQVWLQCSPVSWDGFALELWGALLFGGRCILQPGQKPEPQLVAELVQQHRVTMLQTSASLFNHLLDHYPKAFEGLSWAATGGEPASAPHVMRALRQFPQMRLINGYGPAETLGFSTTRDLRADEESGGSVPVGRPIANKRVYVLDEQVQPVPVGTVGEIYIGGVGLARGYIGRAALTAQRFMADPFSAQPGGRLYRTGDLGRWRSDGAIEYVGRNDDQVKIRGYRVELGEIEIQLLRQEQVQAAAALVREDVPGEQRLVGYVVPARIEQPPSVEVLRMHLQKALPEYMVPAAFVILERLPLTANGKLDRRALPPPQLSAFASGQYQQPQGEVEQILAGIWQELLAIERVGRGDNFFQLGGHSLLIVQMLERLRRVGLSTDVRSVYESASLADLAGALMSGTVAHFDVPANRIPWGCEQITPEMLPLISLAAEHIEQIVGTVPGGTTNVQDIYPLAPLQEGLLFHHLLNEDRGDTYVLAMLLSVSCRERFNAFVAALQVVINRHDILRTAVLWAGLPRPVQVVYRQALLPVKEVTLDAHRDLQEQLDEWLRPEHQQVDLRAAPLMRLQAAKSPQGEQWYALLQFHHITNDHVTFELVLAEAAACLEGRGQSLPEPAPFRNHIAQVLAYATTHDSDAFFRSKLSDIDEPTAPFGIVEVLGVEGRIDEAHQLLEPELARRVRTQTRLLGVSAATMFHAAWGLVTAHTTGRDDVVFGSVLLGRLQGSAGGQRTLGMFINTLPLRLSLQQLTSRKLIERTQRELVELLGHEQASLATAQRCSAIAGAAPLFTSLLNYRHNAPESQTQWSSAAGVQLLSVKESTNYPVTVSVDDLGAGFGLSAQTDPRIDPRRLVAYLHTAVSSLVDALEQGRRTPALSLSILPDSERRHLLEVFGVIHASHPQESLIHQLFEAQAERSPDAVAVYCERQCLTYAGLNSRANQLARHLAATGAGPDQLVGVCVERSLEMVIGVLGVLKAGAAYVPLDPSYPGERLSYMLEDAAPKVLLIQEHLRQRLSGVTMPLIALDSDWHRIAEHSDSNLPSGAPNHDPQQLAYVIYTSGSTGTPKGVMVEHRNVTRLFAATEQYFNFNAADVFTLFHSLAFDFSVWELWGALLCGGRVVVVPYLTARSPDEFYRLLCEEGVTVLNQTPTAFTQLIDAQVQSESALPHALRVVIFGGEALELHKLRPWVRRNGAAGPQLVNMYGITETTVHVTYCPLTERDIESASSSIIGRPIADLRVRLLNRHGQPVPIGVAGEIYVGGAGLARGYLNHPELTAERFLRDPFSAERRDRMYKSGDLARWRADGSLEFLGRNDDQVKIRGYRIELGEISAQLLRHEHIREGVVITREDVPGEKRLVAYVVGDSHWHAMPSNAEDLRTFLKAALPEHMVPSAFVTLERLPLSANGKLDRRALPAPDMSAYGSRQYEAPQGKVEQLVAALWQELLRLERVGRHDNFFELGGHSLKVVTLMDRLHRAGLSTTVRRVFESSTLAELAGSLTRDTANHFVVPPNLIPAACDAISPEMLPLVELTSEHIAQIVQAVPGGAANIQDIYPLAPLQEGILFHHLLTEQRGDTYVVANLLSVASRERVGDLIAALQAVIDRHDILRTAVLWEQLPRPLQVVYRQTTLPVEELLLDHDRSPAEQLIGEWMRPERQRLDLHRAPLLRLQIAADPGSAQWYALLQFHHITCDHVTTDVVISEVTAHLEARTATLPAPAPYRNHVAQALAYSRTNDSENVFRSKFGDLDELTAPFGLADVHGDGSDIEEAQEVLGSALSQRTRMQARRLGVSVATLFHAAWALVTGYTSGRDDVVFGTVLLGRMQGSAGAQRSLGMFINTLPLRLKLRDVNVKELVAQTQRELVELLDHEQASLAVAQRCSGMTGALPLFTTLFNYRHGAPDASAGWPGAKGVQLLAAQERTNFPITFSVDDVDEGFLLTAQTVRRIEPRRLTGYVRKAMQSLIDALEKAPQTAALSLSILPEAEQLQVIELFNAPQVSYPQHQLIHQLFEEQVERTPDAVAVLYQGRSLTYTELNSRANQLARYLVEEGVRPDGLVGICLERGLEMVVGLLAILKAGGAYVPLDPKYPGERLQFMVRDAAPKILLTHGELRSRFAGTSAKVVAVDDDWTVICRRDTSNLDAAALRLHPDNLAYVIYTSGSTGQPKGVMIEHRNVTRLFAATQGWCHFTQRDVFTLFHSFAFDASVWELWGALFHGGRAVVVPYQTSRSPQAFYHLLCEHEVTVLFQTPSAFIQLIDAQADSVGMRHSLRQIVFGGEALELRKLRPWVAHNDVEQTQLVNMYGITETTVHVTVRVLTREEIECEDGSPIGRAMPDLRLHLLNAHGQPVPVGVTGEIYVGGAGVARGYLNRSGLTAERFIADPFSADPKARLYKTGDLGRWRAEGTVDYLGRNDHQVKIRGFRIELGEIEARLIQHPQVRQALVIAREDVPGEKRLAAYVIAASSNGSRELQPSAETLRSHLKETLPEYMVPGAIVVLERFALTVNGKLDRKALPIPDMSEQLQHQYVAPLTATEQVMARIWSEVLHLERVGIRDNFFELGGDSITMVRVLAKTRSITERSIGIVDLFKYPTVRELSAHCDGAEASAFDVEQLRTRAERRRRKIKRTERSSSGVA